MSNKKTKDCIIFIQDVGSNMIQPDSKGDNPFEVSKNCITQILLRKLFSQGTEVFTLITFGDKETRNALANGTQYKNVNEQTGNFVIIDRDFLRLVENLQVNQHNVGDWLDAIVVAMNFLQKEIHYESCTQSQLVLFSNFNSPTSVDQADVIIEKLKEMRIQLTVIGPEVMMDVSVSKILNNGMKYALKMIEEVNGTFCSFETARVELMNLTRKSVRPTPWNALFKISANIKIPIRAFKRVAEGRPYKWIFGSVDNDNTEVQKETVHVRYDEENEVEVEVDRDDLIDAYLFGSTIVPFSNVEKETMSYKSDAKGLYFIACTQKSNIPQFILTGEGSYVVFSRQGDSVGKTVLESFVQAMFDEKLVGIARKTYTDNTAPRIGILHPEVNSNGRYFVYTDLPFAEDEHIFKFPSFSKVVVSKEQREVVDKLVDSMDLDIIDSDEIIRDYSQMNDPHEQYILRCLGFRYMHPSEPLPKKILEDLSKLMEPDPIVVERSEKCLSDIKDKFPLVKVIKKPKNPPNSSTSGVLTDEIKSSSLFKNIENKSECSIEQVSNRAIIEQILEFCQNQLSENSNNSELINLLVTLRKNCVLKDFKEYNDILIYINKEIQRKKCFSLWNVIVEDKLSLISKEECLFSNIDDNLAAKCLLQNENDYDKVTTSIETDGVGDSWLDDL